MLEVLIEDLNPVSGAQSDMRSEHPDPRSLVHRTVSPACGGSESRPEAVRTKDVAHSSAHPTTCITLRHEHWHIGIVDAPIHYFLEPDSRPDVHWFPLPGRGKYLADPFGLPRGDGLEVLFEEFDLGTRKGVISAASLDAKGGVSDPQVVLDLPFHASYPFLGERRGPVFCIPETSQGREVALYRAVEFLQRWTKEATLIRGVAAVDNTVFEHEGRFWLMHTDAEDGLFTKLRMWHAPDLLGLWTPNA